MVRFHRGYAAAAAALFAIEAAIAWRLESGFIRTHLGDALVVMLLYCLAATVLRMRPFVLAASVFAFAVAVEASQAMGLAAHLGLADTPLARLTLGQTFDWRDIAMYAVGCTVAPLLDAARGLGSDVRD